ncbi:hypothetical protein [Aliikangiella maris]|uniref:Phosphate ABC transporter substrate-binding protein n=2 Tax=Aliikangiella maris TaxID=3162458 RepID=A0ABV2BRZ4_9GAMM
MKIVKLSLVVISLLIATAAYGEVAVIVHPSNTADISTTDISRIFLGKLKKFSNDSTAVPINQNEGTAITDEFNQKLLQKTASQLIAFI